MSIGLYKIFAIFQKYFFKSIDIYFRRFFLFRAGMPIATDRRRDRCTVPDSTPGGGYMRAGAGGVSRLSTRKIEKDHFQKFSEISKRTYLLQKYLKYFKNTIDILDML